MEVRGLLKHIREREDQLFLVLTVKSTLDDGLDVKSVWRAIPDFTLGGISLKQFVAVHDAADSLDKEYSRKGVELDGVKANRDDKVRELNDLITRFRSGIRAAYGPDSAVYEQAGGTRSSLRKSPTRQAAADPVTKPAVTSNA
ncbi:MAG TPA: hypothetical protein VE422_21655 [Terriglobia bacterium]|nr:hypothetical protein [Terriglobia bacterium]